ncbi:Maltose acetyltransferase [Phytophthora boehmeriae]|uniref:Maltose acetyltransferase n=1 Tax=Phytophthora boehmeriae TaxID=109152 RepID=A0A8T1X0F8_9STRA|nr:Maltose acetyltransferase [Phytophthora boehmeriae]
MAATAASALRSADLHRRIQESEQQTQGTCSFYPPDERGCRAPRSCYDCLNAELKAEPEGCMVNERGQCVSIVDNYDSTLDFRVVLVANADSKHNSSSSDKSNETTPHHARALEFPAVNATYCEISDTRDENQLTALGFSYGSGGCVVIAVCEDPGWVNAVGGSDCSKDTLAPTNWVDPIHASGDKPFGQPPKPRRGDSTTGYLVFWCVAISILLTLLATLVMVVTIRLHHRKQRREEPRRCTISVGEPIASATESVTPKTTKRGFQLLSLFGWESMRADLIEKERQEMQVRLRLSSAHVSESSLPAASPSTRYLQLASVVPSAPTMSPTTPSAPIFTES